MVTIYVCPQATGVHDLSDPYKEDWYYLVAETGEGLTFGFFRNKWEAKRRLYEQNPVVQDLCQQKYGETRCRFLGQDDMTPGELFSRNMFNMAMIETSRFSVS